MTAPALSAKAWAVARKASNSAVSIIGAARGVFAFSIENQMVLTGRLLAMQFRVRAVIVLHQCFRNAATKDLKTLLFVRRNDILLQRGMALQAIPLPSLGVSSLDLGRSVKRTAPFFVMVQLFGRSARNLKA
ncbi:MAG TPA: hypothetical protein VNJ31_04705 [Methyloceanibacter sp.]|nr:hypothetical protein [Methyloceanibacter sp.]